VNTASGLVAAINCSFFLKKAKEQADSLHCREAWGALAGVHRGRPFLCENRKRCVMKTPLTNSPNPLCNSSKFQFDDFYQEFLLLETSIYGLCNWLKNYEEDLYEDLQIGIMLQINRVKQMLYSL
jgi:hypothetical protein